MSGIINIIGDILLIIGTFFVVAGAVGIVRMPDFFTRIHPAGVIDSGGTICVLLGVICKIGFTIVSLKVFYLLMFVLVTAPSATHILAKTAIAKNMLINAKQPGDKYGL